MKLVTVSKLKDEHLQHLQKTPFWLLLDAIRKTDLNQHEFQKCDDIVMRIIQTFVPDKSAFMIGGKHIEFTSINMQLIFGIQGGKKSLDVSHGPRLPTDFIQRRCPKISRINLKTIKELLMDALLGDTTQDHQDVAKLLSLYLCGKLFFATSGETMGWGFVRVVEDLDNMKAYDWAGAICTTLMESIKGFHSKPEKVTGCVTVLLFWICEHTNLIQVDRRDGFSRFMKWNISKLVTKIRAVDIEQPNDMEVVVGDLHISHFERRFMKTKDVKQIGGKAECSKRSGIGAESNDQCARGASMSEEYQRTLLDIGVLKIELVRKSDVIFELQTKQETMRAAYEEKCAKLEQEITVNNKQKECDIERMKQLVDELNDKNAKLVEQLEEYAVHEYTQAAAGVQEMKQSNEEMYHSEANVLAIMPLSTSFPSDVNEKAELQGVDTHVTPINDIRQMACDVDLVAGINQNTRTTALQNSLVRNIKKKNRKEHKLPEYEYPLVLGRQMKPSDSGVVNQGDCDSKQEMEDDIIEVDNIADPDRTFSRFDLTNRLPIWKLLSTQEREKLKEAYEKGGDSAQVWTGPHVSNFVSFNDIRAIVKGLTLRGNVIDAYADMLMYEQQKKAPKSADDEKLYIFSTLCLATIRDVAEDVHDRYLALRAPHALKARYIQFPIHLDNHWTLMVYDTEEGFWLHYNSMKPRRGREDKHYWEASLLTEGGHS